MLVIFKRGGHGAHVTTNCCGALYLIVVICNVTRWQQGKLMSVYVLVAAVLGHVLCMKRKSGSSGGCKYEFFCSDFA
jgi:hypothetical protein